MGKECFSNIDYTLAKASTSNEEKAITFNEKFSLKFYQDCSKESYITFEPIHPSSTYMCAVVYYEVNACGIRYKIMRWHGIYVCSQLVTYST